MSPFWRRLPAKDQVALTLAFADLHTAMNKIHEIPREVREIILGEDNDTKQKLLRSRPDVLETVRVFERASTRLHTLLIKVLFTQAVVEAETDLARMGFQMPEDLKESFVIGFGMDESNFGEYYHLMQPIFDRIANDAFGIQVKALFG